MTRVSLKEAYDNKDVVAQIYAIRDSANTASEHVDALVPQVEGAVQNANNASASAQASAQTVAGYENRLSTVESDLNAVTLRVTTAEGQIVTIQGRVTALETADGQNVKLTGDQTIGGVKHFTDPPTAPTTATGLWDVQVANGEKVKNELDNYAFMLRTSNNQVFSGIKKAGPDGFIRKSSATMSLTSPPAETVNDETYILEDINGKTVVSNFNSFTPNAQTIYQISTKYPFEEGGVIKTVTGYIWLAVYNNRVVLFLRYTDKNGVSHLKEISSVSETDP